VIAAARAIVERDDIETLTMRRVARELGSSPMAIYRHVRDKDELLVLLLDQLAAELPRPRFSDEPQERLYQACRAMHDGLASHEWVVDVLAAGDLIAPSILWLVEEIVAALIACGRTEREAAEGYRAIWQYTVGELITQRGIRRTAALGRVPFVVQVLTSVDPEALPTLAALAPYWVPARDRDSYDVGVRALLHGLVS
jgi:AcrR family transcriptional regulator